uniref:NTR domain-containing protein n=1 Tax=Parastrongyloides trichosuri TaxID=131310 RepID=A0A0N4Z101_PARTI
MIFYIFLLFIYLFHSSNACTCRLKSLQDVVCSSDWVSHVSILGKYDILSIDGSVEGPQIAGNMMYVALHKEIFTLPDNESEIEPLIFTPKLDILCGVTELMVGKEYLLAGYYTGDINRIKLCDQMSVKNNQKIFITPEWFQIQEEEKIKLRKGEYKCSD